MSSRTIFSFAELEQLTSATPCQLLSTLGDYADTGAAIIGRVAIDVLRRLTPPPSTRQLRMLLEAAERGVAKHQRMMEPREVAQYEEVARALRRRLSEAKEAAA